ncbi:MAG: class C sortase [Actinomycetaceae bacterium]|nr:class C sortase [Actinomycetaceae bacterium]
MAKHAQQASASVRPRSQAGARPSRLLPAIAALLMFAGATIFLYPFAAQWINQYKQAKIVDAYSKIGADARPPEEQQLEEAKKYNSMLASGNLVDIAGHVPTIREQGKAPETYGIKPYEQQLAVDNTGLMARIKVPSADVDLPVYHGTSDETLLQGAGHLQGTALPVGGAGTRTVITGHRGLASATMFTYLDRVKKGDEFTIEVFGQVLAYRVFDIKIVDPQDTATIKAVPGKDLATLITCTPLGINTQRIVITGERIIPTPASDKAGQTSDLPHFPWWLVTWLGIALLLGFFYWLLTRRPAVKHYAPGPVRQLKTLARVHRPAS